MPVNQERLDHLFVTWAAEVGMVMDTAKDRADFAARGHLYPDPGSDAHDPDEYPDGDPDEFTDD